VSERGLFVRSTAGVGDGSARLADFRGGVAEGWPDLVDVELDDGALVAVAGLE